MSQVAFNVVLPRDARAEDVLPKIDAACRVINEKLDLDFRHARREETGPGVVSVIWEDRNAGKISLVHDTNTPMLYVSPFLRMSYGNHTVFDAIERHVPSVPVARLREEAEQEGPGRAAAITRLGIGETEDYDPRTVAALASALASVDVEERSAATMAIFLLKWSAFRGPLGAAIAVETDPGVLRQLEVAQQYLHSSLIV